MKTGGKMTHEYLTLKSRYMCVSISKIHVSVYKSTTFLRKHYALEIHRTSENFWPSPHWTGVCQSDPSYRPRSGWPEAMWVWPCAGTEGAIAMGEEHG